MDTNVNLGVFNPENITKLQARIAARAKEVQRRALARRGNDFVIPRGKLTVTTTDDDKALMLAFDVQGKDGVVSRKEIPVMRSALHQIAGATNFAATTLDRLMNANHTDMAAWNLDQLMSREPNTESGKLRSHLVRARDGQVDAFLGSSYRAISNDDVLTVALQEFEKHNVQVWDLRLTDTNFKVLAFAPHISGQITTDRNFSGMSRWEGKEGDVLNAGFQVTNSETGHGKFTATSAILRRICCNFNIWADVVARRHIGSKLQEGEQDWTSDETKSLEDAALLSKVRDAINTTFNPVEFRKVIDRINLTTTRELGDKPILVVDAAVKVFGLNQERKDAIIEKLLRSGDKSQYGLVQAITAQVNPEHSDKLDDESMSVFEEAGGKLLAYSERDWNAFVKGAYDVKPAKVEDKAPAQTVKVIA